jgi:hypothetical protein
MRGSDRPHLSFAARSPEHPPNVRRAPLQLPVFHDDRGHHVPRETSRYPPTSGCPLCVGGVPPAVESRFLRGFPKATPGGAGTPAALGSGAPLASGVPQPRGRRPPHQPRDRLQHRAGGNGSGCPDATGGRGLPLARSPVLATRVERFFQSGAQSWGGRGGRGGARGLVVVSRGELDRSVLVGCADEGPRVSWRARGERGAVGRVDSGTLWRPVGTAWCGGEAERCGACRSGRGRGCGAGRVSRAGAAPAVERRPVGSSLSVGVSMVQ